MHPSRALPGYTNILVTRGPPEGSPGAPASLSQYDSSGTLDSQSTRVHSDEEDRRHPALRHTRPHSRPGRASHPSSSSTYNKTRFRTTPAASSWSSKKSAGWIGNAYSSPLQMTNTRRCTSAATGSSGTSFHMCGEKPPRLAPFAPRLSLRTRPGHTPWLRVRVKGEFP